MRKRHALALALAALLCTAAGGDPADRLADPVKEAQARHLFRQVRCLVCQNESIDDSEAPLAADLRRTVREQVAAGRSDAEIERFLVARYGEFVLFQPAFSLGNAILWLTPFAIIGLGGLGFLAFARRRRGLDAPLTDEEEERVRALAHSVGDATVPPQDGPTNSAGPAI